MGTKPVVQTRMINLSRRMCRVAAFDAAVAGALMPIVMYVVILVAVSWKSKKQAGRKLWRWTEYRESVNGLETSWCTARREMKIESGEGIRNHGKGNSLKEIKIYVRKKN
jgi:hypothetical protein